MVRITQAELNSVIGGRSNWESLAASANKWSLDPATANSITPAQRQQIRALAALAQSKLNQKMTVLNKADSDLLNAGSAQEHHKILNAVHNQIFETDLSTQSTGNVVDGLVNKYR